jgi:hypothetical protein
LTSRLCALIEQRPARWTPVVPKRSLRRAGGPDRPGRTRRHVWIQNNTCFQAIDRHGLTYQCCSSPTQLALRPCTGQLLLVRRAGRRPAGTTKSFERSETDDKPSEISISTMDYLHRLRDVAALASRGVRSSRRSRAGKRAHICTHMKIRLLHSLKGDQQVSLIN